MPVFHVRPWLRILLSRANAHSVFTASLRPLTLRLTTRHHATKHATPLTTCTARQHRKKRVAHSSSNGYSSLSVSLDQATGKVQQQQQDLPTHGSGAGDTDTIAAIITGAVQGTVAIIRLSGPDAVPVSTKLFRRGKYKPSDGNSAGAGLSDMQFKSHRAYYGHVMDPGAPQGPPLDEVLLLPMLGRRSYTAEDVVELHCHGGGVCAQRVLQACLAKGARLARPGEFTLRAFLNGRLDLSQAESVVELLQARTVAAADSALAGLQGGVGSMVGSLRRQCLDLLAEMEARLDFDEDLPPLNEYELVQQLTNIRQQVEIALGTARQGQLLQRGLQVALVGRPNVGKSSLLNRWSGAEKAIVTDIAGTTRDVVEAGINIGGVPVTLLDTAGLRESMDTVEAIGVQRSRAAAQDADIIIMVADATDGWTDADTEIVQTLFPALYHADGQTDGQGAHGGPQKGPMAVLVLNKIDAVPGDASSANGVSQHCVEIKEQARVAESQHAAAQRMGVPGECAAAFSSILLTSAVEGFGMKDLAAAVLELAGAPQLASGGSVAWAVNERQAEALTRAQEALQCTADSLQQQLPVDFWTIDLRAALVALGEVSGDEVAEEVLDTIFSRFCIGK